VVVQPSGGCPDELPRIKRTTPGRFAPPPLVRGNVLVDAAREIHGAGDVTEELKTQTFSKKFDSDAELSLPIGGYAKNAAKRC
jgi:hypothetical protein